MSASFDEVADALRAHLGHDVSTTKWPGGRMTIRCETCRLMLPPLEPIVLHTASATQLRTMAEFEQMFGPAPTVIPGRLQPEQPHPDTDRQFTVCLVLSISLNATALFVHSWPLTVGGLLFLLLATIFFIVGRRGRT